MAKAQDFVNLLTPKLIQEVDSMNDIHVSTFESTYPELRDYALVLDSEDKKRYEDLLYSVMENGFLKDEVNYRVYYQMFLESPIKMFNGLFKMNPVDHLFDTTDSLEEFKSKFNFPVVEESIGHSPMEMHEIITSAQVNPLEESVNTVEDDLGLGVYFNTATDETETLVFDERGDTEIPIAEKVEEEIDTSSNESNTDSYEFEFDDPEVSESEPVKSIEFEDNNLVGVTEEVRTETISNETVTEEDSIYNNVSPEESSDWDFEELMGNAEEVASSLEGESVIIMEPEEETEEEEIEGIFKSSSSELEEGSKEPVGIDEAESKVDTYEISPVESNESTVSVISDMPKGLMINSDQFGVFMERFQNEDPIRVKAMMVHLLNSSYRSGDVRTVSHVVAELLSLDRMMKEVGR